MQLKYVNQAAKTQDIQVPGIQVEPMIHLHVYEVDKKIGLALLESDPKHWKEVLPKEEKAKPKPKPKPRDRTIKSEATPEAEQPTVREWQYPYPPTGDTSAEDEYTEDEWDDNDTENDYNYVPFESDDTRKDGN